VAALTLVVAAAYSLFEVEQQWHFRTAGYDLGIFAQAIRGYAHFSAPVSLMKGVHNGFGTHFSILGDHFSPILALLGPVYRLFPHATTLLVAQGVLFAASVPSVWLFSRRKLGSLPAYLIAVAYALSWGLQAAMASDFHEVAFAVPLLAIAIERLDAGRLRSSVVAAAALLLVKEDFGLVVAVFGLVVGIRSKRWRIARILALAGISTTVLADQVLIPLAGGRSGYYWDYYAALGANPAEAAWHVVRHALSTWTYAFAPHAKITLLRWLFAPLGFLSFGSSFVLLSLPLLAERLLSSNPNHWTLTHQYSAPFMPILTLAAVDTVGKLVRLLQPSVEVGRASHRRGRRPFGAGSVVAFGYAVGVVAVAIWAAGRMPFHDLVQPSEYRTSAYEKAQQGAIAAVPDGVTVEASNSLAPHLVDRDQVMLLDATPHNAPWVVFDQGFVEFPLVDGAQVAQRTGWLAAHGYHQVYDRAGLCVYHRSGS
jgi:uncharacterized membrane protein